MTETQPAENEDQASEFANDSALSAVIVKRSRRGLLFHTIQTVGRIVSAFLTVMMMISVAAVFRLAEGGIDFAALKPYLDRELSRYGMADQLGFDTLVLEWDEEQNDLGLFARNVRLKGDLIGQDSQNLIIIPAVEVGVDLAEILLGKLRLKELVFSELYLSVTRNPTGQIGLNIGLDQQFGAGFSAAVPAGKSTSGPVVDATRTMQDILDRWTASGAGDGLLSRLERVSITEGVLSLNDEMHERQYQARNVDISATRFADHIILSASTEVLVSQSRTDISHPKIALRLDYLPDRSFDFSGSVDGLHTSQVAILVPEIREIRDIDIGLSATFEAHIQENGAIQPIDFRLLAENGTLTRVDLFPNPVSIHTLVAEGQADWQNESLIIDRAALETDLPVITSSGRIWRGPKGVHIDLKADLTPVPVERLMDYWPKPAADGARRWVAEHIVAGRATGASVRVKLGPDVLSGQIDELPKGSLDFRFAYEDLVLNLFDGFPPVTGIRGQARSDHQNMVFSIDAARGGDLVLSNGRVLIKDLYAKEIPDTIIGFRGTGAAKSALTLINTPPLDLASSLGLDPSAVGGNTVTDVEFRFPMHKELSLADIQVTTQSRLTNISWPEAVPGFSVSDGEFTLNADNKQFHLEGEARLNNVAARLEWENKFARENPIKQKVNLYTELSSVEWQQFDLPPLPGHEGLIGISLALFQNQDSVWSALATGDLTRASLSVPELLWEKPSGTPATVRSSTEFTPNVPFFVNKIEFDLNDISGKAEVFLGAKERDFHQARITDLVYGETQTDITIGHQGGDGWLAIIQGEKVDLRPFQKLLVGQEEEDQTTVVEEKARGLPAIRAKLRVGELILNDKVTIQAFRADGEYRDDQLERLNAKGLIGDQGVAVSVIPKDGGRDFSMTLRDSGEMLAYLTGNQNLAGGVLSARGSLDDSGPETSITGNLVIEDFRIIEAPALARLLNVATLLGIAAELEGQGIPFNRLEAPFVYKDNVLAIDNARASGTSMGLTLRGRVDYNSDQIDLDGAVIPAYALNRIFGVIPILGKILGGANEEGLLAVSYRMHGSAQNPDITVNPLSVLAPGLLRDVFSSILKGVQGGAIVDPDAPPPPKPTKPER